MQAIHSISRKKLNEILLDKAESYKNIEFHFQHKLVTADLEKCSLTFERQDVVDDREVTVDADLIIGCDGSYSAVRREMMRRTRFNFSQTYAQQSYVEFGIQPINGDFALAPHFLHIWPRGKFILVAFPNTNKSMTLAAFLPTATFDMLKNKGSIIDFFQDNFRDILDLIGRDNLVQTFLTADPQPLISIKCSPYNYRGKTLIMGDAAHAMVPFYGQGLNCGLEDCMVLEDALDKHGDDMEQALDYYSKTRNPDAEAMCDLAFSNFEEVELN